LRLWAVRSGNLVRIGVYSFCVKIDNPHRPPQPRAAKEEAAMAEPARPHLKLVVPEETQPEPLTPGEVLHHIQLMKARCAWEEIVRAFHPFDDKKTGSSPKALSVILVMQDTAFALSQTKRFPRGHRPAPSLPPDLDPRKLPGGRIPRIQLLRRAHV
jgi:hypothetical protein